MVNETVLIGHLGQDPEFKNLDNGSQLCKLSLATTHTWKDQAGVKQETTDWHDAIAWGGTAELMQKYLRKGSRVRVKGRLTYEIWKDQNDMRHKTAKVVVNQFLLLDKKEVTV